MSDADPKRRLSGWLRRRPEDYDYDDVIVSIPFVYGAGFVVWWLLNVRMHLAMGGSSVLAAGVLVEALFLNPPGP